MDTQPSSTLTHLNSAAQEFVPGSTVIYGMHGKCNVLAVETKKVGEQYIRFYKLEVQKSALSRSTRPEPAIWLPVDSAKDRGLRNPINREQAEEALKILSSREYYFPIQENWSQTHSVLESCIRSEGNIGLAKVASYLHVLKKRMIVPTSEVNKFSEQVNKLLFRELSEILSEPIKSLEQRISKGMRQKLLPDT